MDFSTIASLSTSRLCPCPLPPLSASFCPIFSYQSIVRLSHFFLIQKNYYPYYRNGRDSSPRAACLPLGAGKKVTNICISCQPGPTGTVITKFVGLGYPNSSESKGFFPTSSLQPGTPQSMMFLAIIPHFHYYLPK